MNCPQWLERFESSSCIEDLSLASSLEQLKTQNALSLPIIRGDLLLELADAAGDLYYRPARNVTGGEKSRVYQEFGYCDQVPEGHMIWLLGRWLENRIKAALTLLDEPPIESNFLINDVVCQKYLPGNLGITAHRDHIAYSQLIILVILNGQGRYFVCKNRQGDEEQEIKHEPGWAILMPGPGYAGRNDRPFHLVRDISKLRYSVGLRHDTRKT